MLEVALYAALWAYGVHLSEALNGPIKAWKRNAVRAALALALAFVLAAVREPP